MEIDEKFDKSGIEPKLRFYYSRYIASSHNNIDALLDRHWRKDALQAGDTLSDSAAIELLSIAACVACEALRYVPKFSSLIVQVVDAVLEGIGPMLTALARSEKISTIAAAEAR